MKYMESWNPLDIFTSEQNEAYKKIAISSTKQQIRNILKSYVGYYDPFCELLQNAMDAVDKRQVEQQDIEKKIKIIINLQENSLYVADNGIGFEKDQFKVFLSPNVTYKTQGVTRGNKGVGTTYLAYGFNNMEIYTKNGNFTQSAKILNAKNWIDDDNNLLEPPLVEVTTNFAEDFPFDFGTSFKIHFTDKEGKKNKDLTWLGIDTAESWKYVLLSNTPLGHLNLDKSPSNINFSLIVIDNIGNKTEIENEPASYYYPHNFIKTNAVDISDVTCWQKNEIEKGRDGSNLPQKFSKKLGVYRFFNNDDLKSLVKRSKTLSSIEEKMLTDFSIKAYGFFCNSVDRWTDFNEKSIGLRKGAVCTSYGLQMATDNMIQGSPIQIPLTSSIGYQKQSHVIIHFSGAEPDLGRKGFQPELKVLAEKLSSMIVSLGLSSWKRLLAADGNYNRRDSQLLELHDYIREMEVHESDSPLLIKNDAFFLPTNKISITSIPKSEQDVVVLFNQLLAGGVIRSIQLMASSTYAKYDGIFKINIDQPEDVHYFDENNNPLGINNTLPLTPGIQTAPAFLEYKYSFDSLIQDFDNEDKHPKDLGLVVVWTMGHNRWKERFQTISYLLPDYQDRRPYHGITHELFDSVSSNQRAFYCIVLEELVSFLNSPTEYINKYENIYNEDI